MADVTHGGMPVTGDTPHDGVDAGRPVKIGGKATTSLPAAVADGDRVDGAFDPRGRQIVVPWYGGAITQIVATLSTTTAATLVAAPGAGLSIYVVSLMVTNGGATISRVQFKDGASGTTRVEGWAAANGGGFNWPAGPGIPWKLTAATLLQWVLSAATTDVRVVLQYFVAP